MKAALVSVSFLIVPAVITFGGALALACGPNEPDPVTPANSPVPTHLEGPQDPSGVPKNPVADAG